MNRIKRFFLVETKSTKFGGVLLEHLILYIVIGAIVGLSFLIPNKYIFVGIIGICSLLFFYSLWLLVLKLFVISDNRHNEKIKAKKYNPIFRPVSLFLEDFEYFINNASESEEIIIRSNEKIFHTLKVIVENGEDGSIVRAYYFDKNQIGSAKDLLINVKSNSLLSNGRLSVYESNNSDPKLLAKKIMELKQKNKNKMHLA